MIQTHHLSKHFGSIRAVDKVSITVGKGEVYGFLGLNGAGKTTTIRLMLGLVRPTSGGVSILGESVSSRSTRVWSSVGHLVETPHAYPELTVRENLDIFRRLRGLKDRDVVSRVMEELNLGEYADRKARHLSMGNAQRLGIAKAMMHRPAVLILDEPSNGLDPAGIVQIRTMLLGLALNDGVTIFVSSHILGEISRLAGRIGVIHRGRLIREALSVELERERRRALQVRTIDARAALSALSSAGFGDVVESDDRILIHDDRAIDHPEVIAQLLVEAEVPPTHLSVVHEDLEAYFLRLVESTADAVQ